MTKLIVSDMDGTLLNDNGELPLQLHETVLRLRSKGIEFAIASGRQYVTLRHLFGDLADELLLIADNGSLVAYKGEIQYTVVIPQERVQAVLVMLRTVPKAHAILCTADNAYMAKADRDLYDRIKSYYAQLELVDNLFDYTQDVIKITICDLEDARTNSAVALSMFTGELQLAVSGSSWLDMTYPGVNKGTALEWVNRELHIPLEHMLAFGDHFNDLEMLQLVPNSYAMKNGQSAIKDIASYTTTRTNHENGVLHTLRELGLLDD